MMYFLFMKRRRVVTMEVLTEVDIKEVPKVDMNKAKDEDMEEVEEYPPLVLNVVR
jgi:hypothetical protein